MLAPIFIAVATLSTAAWGQDLAGLVGDLSSGCQAAAGNLLSSNLASCANILGLVSVVSATGSVVDPVNSWISGICSSDPCSDSDLATANANIQSGCSTDLASGNQAAEALNLITANYTQLREVTCLQATSNSTFCLTNFLSGVQTSTGQNITKDFVVDLFQTPDSIISTLSNVPAGTLCTDCDKAIINSVSSLLESDQSSNLKTAAEGKCGAAFVDGTTPSTVSSTSTTSAAMNLRSSTLSLAVVAVGAFLLA